MDYGNITQFISSVGFPIACCIAMFYYVNSTMKDLQKTIENNTLTISKLLAKLDVDD